MNETHFRTLAVASLLALASCKQKEAEAPPPPPPVEIAPAEYKIVDLGTKLKVTNLTATSWPDYDVNSTNGFVYNGLVTLPAGESVVIDKIDFLKGDKGLSVRFNPKKDKLVGFEVRSKQKPVRKTIRHNEWR